jgi:hypothetical protein
MLRNMFGVVSCQHYAVVSFTAVGLKIANARTARVMK